MSTNQPKAPTHEEARELLDLLPPGVRPSKSAVGKQMLSYIAAASTREAEFLKLNYRRELLVGENEGLKARISELEREVAELRAVRIPCDVCDREWCGGCTVRFDSLRRGRSMSLGDLVGEKKL